MYPAPAWRISAAVGKATKPGISVIEPTVAARITPTHPEFLPISLDMVCPARYNADKEDDDQN